MNDKIKSVKIKPFPIAAKMTILGQTVSGQILKLTPTGFLIEAPTPGLKTGTKFQIEFELPLIKQVVNEPCVLVKLYTTMEQHVIEGHFQSVTPASETYIMRFLKSIPRAGGAPA